MLDPDKKTLKYVNAGHNPPFLIRNKSNKIKLLKSTGYVLGVVKDAELEDGEVKLRKGDIFVFYTDGVTEAMNENNEQFGEERLKKVILKNRKLSAQKMIRKIQNEVKTFTGKRPQFDDLTLMVLKVV